MKKKVFFVILTLVLLLAGSFFYLKRNKYDVINPQRGPITEAVYGLGKVKSHHHYEVIIGVLNNIKKVFVEEGEFAPKGHPLIQLQDGGIFHAPFSGTVTLVRYKQGEVALPQVPLLRLEDLKDCYIELSLEQEAALRVQKGQSAKISFESIRNKVLEGKVTAIFPRENEFLAHVQVKGLESGVLPGMTADVSIEIGTIRDAMLLPASVITNGLVVVKRDGRWISERVEIGHVNGTHVQVLGNNIRLDDQIRLKKGE